MGITALARSLFGGVIQTPSGNYRGRYRVKGTDYDTPTCPTSQTKTQVRNLVAEIHAQAVRGDWQPPEPVFFRVCQSAQEPTLGSSQES